MRKKEGWHGRRQEGRRLGIKEVGRESSKVWTQEREEGRKWWMDGRKIGKKREKGRREGNKERMG